MKTSDAIFDILRGYVDTVFFVPGGGAMHLVDSLGRSGLKHISMLHEQGAAFAACGYAQQRRGLGVCLVTSGPGATNAITGCAAAWMDSLPVLFISGQSNLNPNEALRVRGVQMVDIIPMVKPITKTCQRVIAPVGSIYNLPHLIEKLLSDRPGPGWIDIPLDIQAVEI